MRRELFEDIDVDEVVLILLDPVDNEITRVDLGLTAAHIDVGTDSPDTN
jgi:hypothetical protein